MMSYIYDTMLHDVEYLGDSSGRMWYKFDNYRLGIMDFDKAKKSNQFNIEIQYTQSHMFKLGKRLDGLDLPFDGDFNQYHIKRIDVSQIVKTPHDYLTNHNFISPYRTIDRISNSGITETVYLGHRKNGNVFRMYNKTIELKVDTKEKPMNYEKIAMFTEYFGDIEDLYTFELELHRRYIKPTFGIDTLADLEKVYSSYHEIVGKIKIYEDNDQNKKNVKLKNHARIDTMQFTEYKEFQRLTKKRYKPSKEHLINRAVEMYGRFSDSLKGEITESDKLFIVDQITSRIIGKSYSYEITESEETEKFNNMLERIEKERFYQDNALEKEALRAFKKVAHNPNPFR